LIPFYYGSGSDSGSGTVIFYGSGSNCLAHYGSGSSSGSASRKVTVTNPAPYLDHKKQYKKICKRYCIFNVNRSSIVSLTRVISTFVIPFYYGSGSSSGSAKAKSYSSGSATLVIKARFLFSAKHAVTCQRPKAAESLKMCEGDSNLRLMVGILVDVRAGPVQFFSVRLVGMRLDGQRLLHAKQEG